MSIPFNSIADGNGIIQGIEREIGAQPGDISGNAARMKAVTADINSAWSDYLALALPSSGPWQFDDSNQTDYPIIRTDIVSGQRDYTFTTDGSGNLIIEILRARILQSATATEYADLRGVDDPGERFSNFHNTNTGVPCAYDKLANGIRFDTIPDYSAAAGLELHISREATSFATSDTTKKPGVPGLHHRWFIIRPAEDHARRNSHANYALLRAERMQMEKDIAAHFGRRERDVRRQITSKPIPGGFR